MREHKYQAWHKKEQKMYIPNYLHFSPEGELFGVLVKEGQLLSIDDFELREYTGLKDKNGKEIYEGDIVCYTSPAEYGLPSTKSIVPVSWDEETAGFDLGYIDHRITIYDDVEVIGNIYEHPELLPEDDFEHKTNQQ